LNFVENFNITSFKPVNPLTFPLPFAPLPPCRPPNPRLTPIPENNVQRLSWGAQKGAGASKKAKDENIDESDRSFAFFEKGAER
jgi:hypothetical protein